MLANVDAMSAAWQTVFFTVAVVLFVVSSVRTWVPTIKAKVDLTALGLALFVFVAAWNAWSAS